MPPRGCSAKRWADWEPSASARPAGGDGFADGFPTASLAALLKARLAQPGLSKADWVKIGTVSRT